MVVFGFLIAKAINKLIIVKSIHIFNFFFIFLVEMRFFCCAYQKWINSGWSVEVGGVKWDGVERLHEIFVFFYLNCVQHYQNIHHTYPHAYTHRALTKLAAFERFANEILYEGWRGVDYWKLMPKLFLWILFVVFIFVIIFEILNNVKIIIKLIVFGDIVLIEFYFKSYPPYALTFLHSNWFIFKKLFSSNLMKMKRQCNEREWWR